MDLTMLSDRAEITDACNRMAWHADRRSWDQLMDVFTDPVQVDYTSLNGGSPATVARADLIAGWRQTLGPLTATQHLVAGHLVAVDGDRASCTANFVATHLRPTGFGEPTWTLGGYYRFDLVRTPSGWRIGGVTMTATWGRGNRAVLGGEAPEATEEGRRR